MNKKIDFDDYVESYSMLLNNQLSFFDKNTDYFAKYKINILKKIIKNNFQGSILEYGCGIGRNIPFIKDAFPNAKITGVDISTKSLEYAQEKYGEYCDFYLVSDIMKKNIKYDVIFIAGVFHHIEPEKRKMVIQNLKFISKFGANIIVFEHNPYNPLTCHMVNTCPFDDDAVLINKKKLIKLFIDEDFTLMKSKYVLFFPSFLFYLRKLELLFSKIPLGGQYFIHVKI